MISILDILELAHSLRQEQLSIANERNSYIKLNEKLKESTSNTSQVLTTYYLDIFFVI